MEVLPPFPGVAGPWHDNGSVTTDTCGLGLVGTPIEGIWTVIQNQDRLTVGVTDICGGALIPRTGTIDRSGNFVVAGTSSATVENCTVDAVGTASGAVDAAALKAIGTDIIKFTARANCGVVFSCEVHESIAGDRCPPANCSIQACAVPFSGADTPLRRLAQRLAAERH